MDNVRTSYSVVLELMIPLKKVHYPLLRIGCDIQLKHLIFFKTFRRGWCMGVTRINGMKLSLNYAIINICCWNHKHRPTWKMVWTVGKTETHSWPRKVVISCWLAWSIAILIQFWHSSEERMGPKFRSQKSWRVTVPLSWDSRRRRRALKMSVHKCFLISTL